MTFVLGVDIGGTKIAVGLVEFTGAAGADSAGADLAGIDLAGGARVVALASSPTPAALGSAAIVAEVVRVASGLLAEARRAGHPVAGCGVGSAGVIDRATGTVVSATSSLTGWAGTPLAAVLEDRLELPVTVLNDVHAHALGEALAGAGRGCPSMMMIAAGTGIGGAFVTDGLVWAGATGLSGHFGHLPAAEAAGLPCTCGREGHLEVIASGPAIAERYRAAGGDPVVTDARGVFARASGAADPIAERTIETAGYALGRAIGGLVNSLDPHAVVVGGGLSDAGEFWWSAVRRGAAAELMPSVAGCPLVPAQLGADAALIGAAAAFVRRARSPAGDHPAAALGHRVVTSS
ncbi:ROK family protein [Subtercola vilae]|uniref:ROK family protein n=1 Tax=Subtercola vilae TaxID=2056433 RepID=A0A4T2C9G2_9MICO|nr:ROK family protein [Subtercola vilae]TIH40061.1 ROK family protein [Subtercola vilae]